MIGNVLSHHEDKFISSLFILFVLTDFFDSQFILNSSICFVAGSPVKEGEDSQSIQNEQDHKHNKKDDSEEFNVVLCVGMGTRRTMK